MSLNIDTILDTHSFGLDVDHREIYLHSYISNTDEDPGVDYRMASHFAKNIRILDLINEKPIIIHMHSIGGDWNDGMSIYDSIKICKSHVTIVVYGQAESMSSIVLQAADTRVMMPNTYFMCHFGSNGCEGSFLDVQNAAKFEKIMAETMMDIYTARCLKGKYFKENYESINEEKIKTFLKRKLKDGDWYLTSQETVHYGFADLVLQTRSHPSIDSLK